MNYKMWIIIISSFVLIALIGAFLNILVMKSNMGRMPVLEKNYEVINDKDHFGYKDPSTIKYNYLSDRFRIGKYVYSPGDILIDIAFFSYIFTIIIYIANFLWRHYHGWKKNRFRKIL